MDPLSGVLIMKEKLRECYDRLQGLDIVATQGNMEILLQTLYDLKAVYRELERMEADGGTAADPERQSDD